MDELSRLVQDVLGKLAVTKKLDPNAHPSEIVVDSLDQMRLLVALEERLGTAFDDGDIEPFNLSSRAALVESVVAMIGPSGWDHV